MINIQRNINCQKKQIPSYKLIWELMKYKPLLYIANCLLWALIHLSPLLPGIIAKKFFDHISNNSGVDNVTWGLLSLLIAAAAGRISAIFLGFKTDVLHRFNTSSLLRVNIMKNILKRPGAESIPFSTGETINCIRDDVYQAEESISWTLDVIGTTIFAIGAVCILSSINSKITLLVFAPLVIVVALAQYGSGHLKRYRDESRDATGKVTGAIGEIFQAVLAIQVARAEKNSLEYLKELNHNRHKSMVKDSLITQLLNSVFENTVSLGTGFILLLCAQSMKDGSFTVGDFTLFVYYLTFVTDFTQFFGNFLAHFQQTGVSFKRMQKLLQCKDDMDLVEHSKLYLFSEPPRKEELKLSQGKKLKKLIVEDISYGYQYNSCVISEVSFEIKKGSFNVICGRIGSGKSTVIKCILGLLQKKSGNLYWNDEKVKKPSEFFIPPISAYTPQSPKIFSDSVRNNILLGLEDKESKEAETKEKLERAIYSSVLEEDINTLENGVDSMVGPRGVKLSGGQVQRVAAARMFAREAELLVFDDISSALDVETEKRLWERIRKRKGSTCLVVSNRRWALQQADNIIVLKDGRVEAQGSLEELLDSCDEFKSIWLN